MNAMYCELKCNLFFGIVEQQKIRCRDCVFDFTDLLSVVISRTTLTYKNVKMKM